MGRKGRRLASLPGVAASPSSAVGRRRGAAFPPVFGAAGATRRQYLGRIGDLQAEQGSKIRRQAGIAHPAGSAAGAGRGGVVGRGNEGDAHLVSFAIRTMPGLRASGVPVVPEHKAFEARVIGTPGRCTAALRRPGLAAVRTRRRQPLWDPPSPGVKPGLRRLGVSNRRGRAGARIRPVPSVPAGFPVASQASWRWDGCRWP